MSSAIQIERVLEIPIEAAWQAWTTESALTSWLTARAKVKLEVGGAYELFWEPEHPERNSTVGCRLTELAPLRRLSFTWRGPVQFADIMNVGEPPATSVRVEFEANGPGQTTVRLEHAGWGDGPHWSDARAWQERAWLGAFEQLHRWLRQHA